jgi:hypothetical protein
MLSFRKLGKPLLGTFITVTVKLPHPVYAHPLFPSSTIGKFSGAHVCRVTFKQLPHFSEVISKLFEPSDNFFKYPSALSLFSHIYHMYIICELFERGGPAF